MFEAADELGCNKIALGHHKDDIAETILMNLLYRGSVACMNPSQDFFGGKVTMIRPLCYVEEAWIRDFAEEMKIVVSGGDERFDFETCPFGEHSRRRYIKEFIQKTQENSTSVDVRSNIFKSLTRIKSDYIDIR